MLGHNEVHTGQVITLTTREDAVATDNLLPIMCVRACGVQNMAMPACFGCNMALLEDAVATRQCAGPAGCERAP